MNPNVLQIQGCLKFEKDADSFFGLMLNGQQAQDLIDMLEYIVKEKDSHLVAISAQFLKKHEVEAMFDLQPRQAAFHLSRLKVPEG